MPKEMIAEKGHTVTAVMFVYNEAEFIGEMIASIVDQSTAVAEIVIVDDQSTDETRSIIEDHAKKDTRISYFYNPQKGKVNALNLGLAQVKTDYYFVCAGDDILSTDYVHINLQLIQQSGLKFLYNTNKELYHPFTDRELGAGIGAELLKITFVQLLNGNTAQGYIFASTNVLKDLMPLSKDLPFEDWYIALKLSKLYGYCSKNPAPTFLYRKHTGSDSANFHRSRSKFLHLLKRNVHLFRFMLTDSAFSEKDKQAFRKNILLQENMMNFNPRKAISILFASGFSMKNKLKSLIYPVIKHLKYRNA